MGRKPRQVDAVEPDFPLIGPHDPGEAVDQGGLAGAVRADERGDLAALDREVHLGEGRQAPKVLAEAGDLEQRIRFYLFHTQNQVAQTSRLCFLDNFLRQLEIGKAALSPLGFYEFLYAQARRLCHQKNLNLFKRSLKNPLSGLGEGFGEGAGATYKKAPGPLSQIIARPEPPPPGAAGPGGF